jgi:hypothetical protein
MLRKRQGLSTSDNNNPILLRTPVPPDVPRPSSKATCLVLFKCALILGSIAIYAYILLNSNVPSLKHPAARSLNPQELTAQQPLIQKKPKKRPVRNAWNHIQRAVKKRNMFKFNKQPTTTTTTDAPSTITIVALSVQESIQLFPMAFTNPVELSSADIAILQEFARRVPAVVDPTELDAVAWGGSEPWWDKAVGSDSVDALNALDGGHLLWSFYKIQQQHCKKRGDLSVVYFPFGICKHGCPAERGIQHTLQWRRTYQPCSVTPACIIENANGFVYHRGLARATNHGAHAMVWARAGQHKHIDALAYFRCVLHAVDQAVAASLQASNGRVGKFNVIVDTAGYSWGNVPKLHFIKQHVTMLQDHFPDRLGMVMIANLSRGTEFVVGLIKPLLTKEVRDKIHILPHGEKLLHELSAIVDRKWIPEWLGGDDTFVFDVQAYYPERMRISDEEGRKFLTEMPYHA